MAEQKNIHSEQRKHLRVNIDLDMYLVLVDTNAEGVVSGNDRIKLRHGKINDISLAGLKITTQDMVPALEFHLLSGSITLAVKFTLPKSNGSISAMAKATWFKQVINLQGRYFTMGLKFIEISPQDQSTITTFIAEHKK
jgi:hypothetical protein